MVAVSGLDIGGCDVTQVDDDVSDRCAHHVIVRRGFGRRSVDSSRRRVLPPSAAAAAPGDVSGSAADGRADRFFRRGESSRSTLPPSLIGPRSGGAGGGSNSASSPTAPCPVQVVAVSGPAVTSLPIVDRSVVAVDVEGRRRAEQQMSLCAAQCSDTNAVIERRLATSMISRIAPPRSSKSKSSSSRSSTDKRPPALASSVASNEQAKKGERLSNYSKGAVLPPRPLRSPEPSEVATAAAGGRTASGVSPPPVGADGRQWPSAIYACGSGLAQERAMETLVEESDEATSTTADDQPRVNSSKTSPKHRSRQVETPCSLRPRTRSMPTGTSRAAVGTDLRSLPPSEGRSHSPGRVTSHSPRPTSPVPIVGSAGYAYGTPNSANVITPGNSSRASTPKIVPPSDNNTCNYLLYLR